MISREYTIAVQSSGMMKVSMHYKTILIYDNTNKLKSRSIFLRKALIR